MNTTNLVGNIVRDVDYKVTASGMAIASFTIAVKRQFKDKTSGQYESDFISCKAFSKTAEIIANNFAKGNKIGVVGSIQTGSYEKSDGTKVFTTDVIVNSITFVESKKQESQQQAYTPPTDPFAVTESDLPF